MAREREINPHRTWRVLVAIATVVVACGLAGPVTASPTADFQCYPAASCTVYPGNPLTLSASSNAAQPDYEWDLNGDGVYGDQTSATVTQTYANAGIYPVGLQVTDISTKQSIVVTHNITVPLTAAFTCSASPSCDAVPVGSTVQLDATSDSPTANYSWDFNSDGVADATGAHATYAYTQPGQHQVAVTVADSAGQSTLTTRTITVSDPQSLHASIACSPSCDVPAGSDVTFTATSNGRAPTYGWYYGSDGPFGPPSTFRQVGSTWTQQLASPGTYVVLVSVTDGGQSVTASQRVTVSPFYRPLPIPRVLSPGTLSPKDAVRCARLRSGFARRSCVAVARQTLVIYMREASVQLAPGQATRMWTFDGTFPGPTIRAQSGQALKVRYVNQLPGAAGPMTIHLHGDHHASADDGQPNQNLIYPGGSRTYTYPLTEDGQPERSAVRWYHDHRMGESGRDVWNGLAGMFILRDGVDARLGLPAGSHDVPLMVTDRKFAAGNQLAYSPGLPAPVDGAIGDHVLVNGAYRPFMNVAQGLYRFRLLNASNWCAYNFQLVDQRQNVVQFLQIGTDGGLMPHRVDRDRILLGPAERADVLVDFQRVGEAVYLRSEPRTDGLGTDACQARDDSGNSGPIMAFRVTGNGDPYPRLPTELRPLPSWTAAVWGDGDKIAAAHTFHLGLGSGSRGAHWTIDGRTFDPRRVDVTARLGATTYWNFVNDSPVTHYMHVHDDECVGGAVSFSAVAAQDRALKDTFRVDPHRTVRIACRFTDYTGVYMIHCHMLEHEDNAMMAQFMVVGRSVTARQIRLAISKVWRAANGRLRATIRRLAPAGYSWARVRAELWLLCHLDAPRARPASAIVWAPARPVRVPSTRRSGP